MKKLSYILIALGILCIPLYLILEDTLENNANVGYIALACPFLLVTGLVLFVLTINDRTGAEIRKSYMNKEKKSNLFIK